MGKITATLFALCVGIAAAGLFAGPTRAATLLVDGTGQLTGARNVDVGGALFDVEFGDGTCSALFDGCDEPSDFPFTTLSSALAAAQALLDQVFLDGVLGNFDTLPELTSGCSDAICTVHFPYAFSTTSPELDGVAILNSGSTDFIIPFSVDPIQGSERREDLTFARFSPVSDVSEPASMLLFGAGLLGLARIRRRRNRGTVARH